MAEHLYKISNILEKHCKKILLESISILVFLLDFVNLG